MPKTKGKDTDTRAEKLAISSWKRAGSGKRALKAMSESGGLPGIDVTAGGRRAKNKAVGGKRCTRRHGVRNRRENGRKRGVLF